MAASDESSGSFDWSVYVVPLIAGLFLIAVAIYNTRGETAALRRLKAMNEVIEKLPEDSDVRPAFAAARDLLAQRVAVRMSKERTVWKKAPTWVVAVFVVVVVSAILGGALIIFPPQVTEWELFGNLSIAIVTLSAVAMSVITDIAGRAEARRRVDAAKAAHPASGQQ